MISELHNAADRARRGLGNVDDMAYIAIRRRDLEALVLHAETPADFCEELDELEGLRGDTEEASQVVAYAGGLPTCPD